MPSTTFLFARHGETADNRRLVFQGQSGKALNALGRAQAKRLAERMRLHRPDVIIASDLERAHETAKIVGEAVDLEPELDPELREVDVGAWTGKSHEEIQDLYPDEWNAWSSGIDIRRGGGETYGELSERIERAVVRAAANHPGRRVLLVSHGGSIKAYVAKMLGVSAEGMRALAGVGNCGLTAIERDVRTGRSRLHAWNDTAHLEGLVVDEHTD
jgi:broad specificity phosphatase PhoE